MILTFFILLLSFFALFMHIYYSFLRSFSLAIMDMDFDSIASDQSISQIASDEASRISLSSQTEPRLFPPSTTSLNIKPTNRYLIINNDANSLEMIKTLELKVV